MNSEISTSVINSMIKKINNPSGISDGYHTFQELYDDRACMVFLIMISNSENAWISKKHSDGSMFKGMFIAGIRITGIDGKVTNITYHIDDKFWDMFSSIFTELDIAPEWDLKDNSVNEFLRCIFSNHPHTKVGVDDV